MVLRIRTEGSEILRKRARVVPRINRAIQRLVDDMLETMYEANGVGLAAPQVGRDLRVVVMDVGEGPWALINPRIASSSGSATDFEGCLSIPGVTGKVTRAESVSVEATDPEGNMVLFEATGLLARAVQHEVDHLDGILFIDKAKDIVRDKDQKH